MEAARARGLRFRRLGSIASRIWQPYRFRRAYAATAEPSYPYLRPYDVFEYLPTAADHLSATRNRGIESYKLKRGMILQTCSGRNLGPAVFVDRYLSEFLIGDDMLRLEIPDEGDCLFVLAFLQTPTAQALLRQGKTGSVIDHISVAHVSTLEVPSLLPELRDAIVSKMGKAVQYRERARLSLRESLEAYEAGFALHRQARLRDGWAIRKHEIANRLDAAYYDPFVREVQSALRSLGGQTLGAIADVTKPPGRYKTVYVGEGYGTPILSGTQVLQAKPINLRHIATRALRDISRYQLRPGWIVFQADGRAEETLGVPAVVTKDRDGWLASGHVGRCCPKSGVDSGQVFLAIRAWSSRLQIRSLACGSVVDATYPDDLERVVVPPLVDDRTASQAMVAWEELATAQTLENDVTQMIEEQLASQARRSN